MFRIDLTQIRLMQPRYSVLELLVKLFSLGIFSVSGGVKAWFELVLVTAALCASGYIIWWQVPLLIATIVLGTLAAGIFSVLAPQYIESGNFEVSKSVAVTLDQINKYNVNQINTLSGDRLEQRLKQVYNARKIFFNNPKITRQIPELKSVCNDINHIYHTANNKVTIQRENYARQKKQEEELERQRNESKAKRQKEEEERKIKKKKWLEEQRRREGFIGGCPPDDQYPSKCKSDYYPFYKVKVTKNLDRKKDGFDGIIWQPSDVRYESVTQPIWFYKSVEEAEAERGKYKFRRPKNSQEKA